MHFTSLKFIELILMCRIDINRRGFVQAAELF